MTVYEVRGVLPNGQYTGWAEVPPERLGMWTTIVSDSGSGFQMRLQPEPVTAITVTRETLRQACIEVENFEPENANLFIRNRFDRLCEALGLTK